MRTADLKLNDRNPRKISEGALKKLAESIQRDPEFMTLRPIVIDGENTVLGGNQRLKAIRSLRMEEIPDSWVVKASDLSEEQMKRFILVDNGPEGMAGEWDLEMLKLDWTLPELESLGFDPFDFEEQIDKLKDGDEITVENSVQLEPPKEYILIMAEPNSIEWEDIKETLKLKMVKRGGYRPDSPMQTVGIERVIWWNDFKERYNAHSNSE